MQAVDNRSVKLCILSLFVCLLAASSGSAQDHFVNPSVPCSGTPCYTTIQAAINAASTGQTILVEAGNYAENITINKALTLNGPNAGVDCDSRVAEAIIAPASGLPVSITADDVTLSGFEINAPDYRNAIVLNDRSNTTISYNNINDIGTNLTGGGNIHAVLNQLGSGNSSNVAISNNCIENIGNSGFSNFSLSAIGVLQSVSTGVLTGLNVENNVINNLNVNTAAWPAGKIAYGIIINVGGGSGYATTTGKVANATISGNSISNLTGFISTGIGLEGNTENVTVEGNTVSNLEGHKLANRAGGGYDLNGVKFENNRFVETVSVLNNRFETNTFVYGPSSTSGLGYAVANYVPSAIGGVASLENNWFGTAMYSELVAEYTTFTGKIFNKEGAGTSFTPYLLNSTIDSLDINYDNGGVHAGVSNLALNYTAASENVVVTFDVTDNSTMIYPIPDLDPTDMGDFATISGKYVALQTALASGNPADIEAAALDLGDDIITEYFYYDNNDPNTGTLVYLQTAGANDLVKTKYWDQYLNNTSTADRYPDLTAGEFEVPIAGLSTSTNPNTGGAVNSGWLTPAYGKDLYVRVTLVHNGNVDIATQSVALVGPVINITQLTQHPTIQDAIDNAAPGDEINISSGTYTENVDASGVGVILAPGNSPGCVTINGNYTLGAANTLAVDVEGVSACTQYDQLTINGGVTLGGASLAITLGTSYTPTLGDSYTIIENDGTDAVNGIFAEGYSVVVGSTLFQIDYAGGDGNDVVLTACSGGVTNTNTSKQFCSIQAAIDDPTTLNGHTLAVAAGTYVEDVNVNKSLTITGADPATTIVSGPSGGDGATFRVAATGITIQGFTITREGNNTTDWNNNLNFAGVAIQGQGNDAIISNNVITGNRTGIDINNSNDNQILNNDIDFNRTGLLFRNQTDNTIVTGNFITDNWTMGILFLDASGGTNSPVQSAINSQFNDNDISGNWYGDVVERQQGGSLPTPGTTNLKNFECNWFGTTTPTTSTLNSTEPGYASLIPTAYGGTATNPGGAPNILGEASGNVMFEPFLVNGADDDSDPSNGFQPVPNSCQGCTSGNIVENTNTGEFFCTIQAAIDDADTQDGHVLDISAGVYNEKVTIDKELTLNGPQADVDPRPSASTTRTPGGSGEAIIDGAGSISEIVEILASNVVLNGLQIRNSTDDMISSPSSSGLDGVEVKYCIINDAVDDEGIQLRDVSNSRVEYNYIFDIAQDAVNLCCGSSNSIIQQNEITNASSVNATIYLYNFGSGLEVRDNLLYDNNTNDGIKLGNGSGGDASTVSNAVIDGNTITNQAQDGISIYSSSATVTNNTITGSGSSNGAIYLAFGISNVTLTGNDINNNATNGIRLNSNVDATTVTINQNAIVNNTIGLQNDAADEVDATANWWGDASGPSGQGPGSGDAVSTNVLFCPWLNAAPPGGTPLSQVYNATQVTYHCTIQDAVNNASPNDLIQVSPGTFPEEVTIDKSLTLEGTGANRTDVVIDGGNTRDNGIVVQSGVTDVTIRNISIQDTDGGSNDAGIRAFTNCDNITIEEVLITDAPGRGGIYVDGPVDGVTIDDVEVTGSGVNGRGIVVWNGFKQNVSITNCYVHDISGCCGIELQDGTASGVSMNNNTVERVGDSGMSATGLRAGAGANTMSNNTITDCGRFGIEIKNPDGTGLTTGDGSIVLDNNMVSFTATTGMNNRDHAGIAVLRIAFLSGNSAGYPDIPTGVVLTNNDVSGYTQISSGATTSEGFGIVIEGTNHTVTSNTVSNCNIGIQQQGGGHPNANYVPNDQGDGDQSDGASPMYFGRGNSPVACGNTISGNTFTSNGQDIRNSPISIASGGSVTNTNTGEIFCTIQAAIDDADTQDGHNLGISSATYNEQVVVNKELTLTGVGAPAPIINIVGLSPSTDFVLQVADENVTLDNLHIQVDDGNGNLSGVVTTATTTFDGLIIQNCLFETLNNSGSPDPVWPSTAVQLGSFGGPPSANDQVTFTGNTIRVGSSATTHFAKAVRAWNIHGDFTGNTIEGFYSLQIGDPSGGPLNISNNTELRGNLELNNLQGGHAHTVSNNLMDISDAYGPNTDFALMELKNNSQSNVSLLISGNTLQNYPGFGIFSGHSAGITVDGNTFTPGSSATAFNHVHINTKHRTSSFSSPGFSSEMTLTNNVFNGNAAAGQTGIAVQLANHDDVDDFGNVVIGTAGNENDFSNDIDRFVVLNDETGTTTGHPIWGSLQVSTMKKVDQDFDVSQNNFDVGSGMKLSTALTVAELYDLEDRMQHAIDDSDLGFLTVVSGESFVTPNSFTSNTLTPSVQRGIDVFSATGTTRVESGNTYTGGADATGSGKDITIAPGASPACVTMLGNLALNSSDVLDIEIDGTNPCTQHDQLTVNGTVTLGGASLNMTLGYTPTFGDQITVIENDGTDAVTGQFAQGTSIVVGGFPFEIDYAGGSGNDVVLTYCAKVENTTQSTLHCSIQEAVDNANPGDVLVADPGIYNENVTIDVGVTLQGAGNGSNPTGNTVLAPGSSCVGTGISITADDVTLDNLYIGDFQTGVQLNGNADPTLQNLTIMDYCNRGIELGGISTDVVIQNVTISQTTPSSTTQGIRAGTAAGLNGLDLSGSTITNNRFGIIIFQNSTTPAPFDNVTIQNSTISNNLQKGMYFEALSNATLYGLVMDNNGTDPTYGFNNGIDINLKYDDYANITIQNSEITNSGATGTSSDPENPAAVAIKARDDAPSYNGTPATLDNVILEGNIITGPNNGIRFGEFGKINSTPTNILLEENDLSHAFGNKAVISRVDGDATLICNWHGATDPLAIWATFTEAGGGVLNLATILDSGTDANGATGFQPGGNCICPTNTDYGTTATAQASPICSGQTAVLDVTSSFPSSLKAFRWSADGDAGSDNSGADMVAFGTGAVSDGPLTNTTGSDIVVTYTIETYTFGEDGVDDGGAGDDCLGDPLTVDVTVGSEPVGTNTSISICSGTGLNVDLNNLISNSQSASFSWMATDNPEVSGENTSAQSGSVIADVLTLDNPGGGPQVVTYTVSTTGLNGCPGSDFTVTVTVENCQINIIDPCTCLDNATTQSNGQFSETIEVTGPAGDDWTVVSAPGLFLSTSPAPPAAPTPVPAGTALVEGPAGTYTLAARHIDAQGYTITVTNGSATLSISNTCYYPNVTINGLEEVLCTRAGAQTVSVSAQLGDGSGPATVETISFTILDGNGDPVGTPQSGSGDSYTFNPADLDAGTYTLRVEFDGADDGASNPGCLQPLEQSFEVRPVGCGNFPWDGD